MSIDFGLWRDLSVIERNFSRLATLDTGFGIDIETGYHGPPREKFALHPETAFIAGVSVSGDRRWARYSPLNHDNADNVDNRAFAFLLAPLLASGKCIAHNGVFELRHMSKFLRDHLTVEELASFGLPPSGYFPIFSDSQVEAYLLGRFPAFNLKDLVLWVYGHQMARLADLFPPMTDKQSKCIRFNVLELTAPVVSYACEDAAYALGLSQDHRPLVMDRLLYRVEMCIVKLVAEMEDYGVAFDWASMARAEKKTEEFAAKMRQEIMRHLSRILEKPVDINLASSAQVADVLYGQLGLKTARRTKTGKMSTDEKALTGLAKKNDAVRKIVIHRELKKLNGSYLTKYPRDFNYAEDGRTHSSMNQTGGGVGGRFSVSDPGNQQLPKEYEYELETGERFYLNFRDFVVAGPEHYLMFFDYCLAPETRVLTSDLRWIPLSDIQEGDELVGFDEEITYRGGKKFSDGLGYGTRSEQAMRRCVVERKSAVRLPSYRLTLEDGSEIVASDDHRWVATDKKEFKNKQRNWGKSDGLRRRWLKTNELNLDCVLHRWVDPWENSEDLSVQDQLDLAYLGGFADGEGWVTAGNVGLGQKPGGVWDRVLSLISKHKFRLGTHDVHKSGVERIYIGGLSHSLRFIGQTRPTRLVERSLKMWEGGRTYSHSSEFNGGIKIVKIERLDDPQDLVAIRTSTGTFVAEGLLTHNSQIELRVLAALSQEPALLRAYKNGEDIHVLTASLLFNITREMVSKKQRQHGKTFNFSTVYGQGVNALADLLGVSVSEAQSQLDKFFSMYPSVRSWVERQTRIGIENGYTTSVFGRIHPIWELESPDRRIRSTGERKCVNSPVQGNAADIAKIAMVRTDIALEKHNLKDRVHMIMNVHDALGFEIHMSVSPQSVIDVIHPEVTFDIPLPGWPKLVVDWEIGRRLGSMVKLNLDENNQIIVPNRGLVAAPPQEAAG